MRMNEGVEWAAHCCILLDWLGDGESGDNEFGDGGSLPDRAPVPAARLAAAFEVPPAYLNKQLQALTKAGILASVPGVRGGFRLNRPLTQITMMDVVAAIEGPDEAFTCTEIRRRGAGAQTPPSAAAMRKPCGISAAMRAAEMAWRRSLAGTTLAALKAGAERDSPRVGERMRGWHARY
ncbi:MAG TPA: Rrf2 family transcriptional regulator [Actinocrinis sp.]|jgi:Rrf2 family protein